MIKISKKKYLAQKLLSASIGIKNHIYDEHRFKMTVIKQPKKVESDTKPLQNRSKNDNREKITQKTSATRIKQKQESHNLDTFEFFKPQKFNLGKFDKLKNTVLECKVCKLCETRKNVVFGEGNPQTNIMFIGEGPGEDEDIQGKPFVGKAGKLLTVMIQAMGLDRKDVFITNIVKCRPPENRNPEDEEIKKCTLYLTRQIDLINPKLIVTLGNFASKFVIQTTTGISKIRGRIFNREHKAIIPIYHPSYLLRNPSGRIDTWKDLQMIKRTIDSKLKL